MCGGIDFVSDGINKNRQFLEALVLWQLGLFGGVFAPVAVTPRLLRRTEAAV